MRRRNALARSRIPAVNGGNFVGISFGALSSEVEEKRDCPEFELDEVESFWVETSDPRSSTDSFECSGRPGIVGLLSYFGNSMRIGRLNSVKLTN
jgi:hypothetical protein